MNDVCVSPAAVREKVLRLKPDSAPGPDGLHPRILHEAASVMAGPWAKLFHSPIDPGRLPKEWSMDEITSLHQKGTKQCPTNYRPVLLTAVSCKVLESWVLDQLVDHLSQTYQLNPDQHGSGQKTSYCI